MKLLFFCCFTLYLLFYNVLCQTSSTTTERNAVSDSHKTKEPQISINITMGTPIPPIPRPSGKVRKSPKFICPDENVSRPFFSIPCKTTKECSQSGNKNMVCCNNRCLKGVPAPPPEPVHSPTLFGLVERVCPSELIPEFFEIKKCTTDADCSPRICCPEKMLSGETVGYCRTPEPKLDNIPGVRQIAEPIRLMMSYMQCTPPPPPVLDVFPKECRYPLDCFPNLCCQERGKRYCRPPKRSLLALLTTVAQRIVPTETARDFINRITT